MSKLTYDQLSLQLLDIAAINLFIKIISNYNHKSKTKTTLQR